MNQKKQSNDDRDKIKQTVTFLFYMKKAKLTQMVYETKKKILQGQLEQAHNNIYKFITDEKDKLGGDDSVFLLPGLLTIAEIHIIEGRLKKAEEYLNAAHWSFLKNNDKTEINKKSKEKSLSLTKEYEFQQIRQQLEYKITLHRTFAKLYQVKNEFKQAINELKQATYLECTKYGPENPYVALNYFLMGKIFVDMGMPAVGQSFYAKVAEIWYRYLKNFFQKSNQEQQAFLIEQLSLEQAINYLIFIEKHFEQAYEDEQVGIVFTPVMRTFYSIGLLYKIFGDDTQCESYLKEVYKKCLKFLPQDDRKTQKIKSMLVGMNVAIDAEALANNRIDHGQTDSDGQQQLDDPAENLMQAGEDE